ncbi:hypothetical protein [Endozoicomonas atrinae]|uniref:hypothetical protein n=1 Tax=Endozoicomonas atrinae TaxID=1333660 RepID=UPI000825015C|nr:hypothetical protein [Endozoicomonas atrinae]
MIKLFRIACEGNCHVDTSLITTVLDTDDRLTGKAYEAHVVDKFIHKMSREHNRQIKDVDIKQIAELNQNGECVYIRGK